MVSCINKVRLLMLSVSFQSCQNDMKMLAFVGGEQNNNAKYFSSFGDVTVDTAIEPTGTYCP